MSNAVKFLLAAVSLIVVVLLAAFIINTMNKGRGSANQSLESYDNMISQFDDIKFSVYADSTTSGSDVINLLKNLNASDGVSVVVVNRTATVTYTINATGALAGTTAAGGTTYDLSDVSDKTNATAYINSLASFSGAVTRDANGAITTVTFTQQ